MLPEWTKQESRMQNEANGWEPMDGYRQISHSLQVTLRFSFYSKTNAKTKLWGAKK